MIEAFFLEHKVHMTGSVRMSLERLQQLAHGSIMRDRVRDWHDSLEPENTLFIALHNRTTFGRCAVLILHVVEALAVGLPDVNLSALDWLAVRVFDVTEDQAWRALWIMGDSASISLKFRIVGVEGS